MKRKFIALALGVAVLPSVILAKDITIKLNNEVVKTDVSPFIKENRTFVPVRFISEKLGFKVDWNEKEKLVTVSNNDKKMELTIDKKEVLLNGKDKSVLDVAPLIKENRTFVPLRFISENFGVKTDWDEKNMAVLLTTKNKDELNLTKEEREYYDKVTALEENLKIKFDELKSYLFEHANEYSEEELNKIYQEKKSEAEKIIAEIQNLNVPDKFKESHKFLLTSLDSLKNVLDGFHDSLIKKSPEAATKVVQDLSVFNIRIAEHLKALKSNAMGVKYDPDEAIKKYNETRTNLMEDPTIKNLLNQIGR